MNDFIFDMKKEKERAYARSGMNYSFQGSTMKTYLPYLNSH
jgi:hypothetical protein